MNFKLKVCTCSCTYVGFASVSTFRLISKLQIDFVEIEHMLMFLLE